MLQSIIKQALKLDLALHSFTYRAAGYLATKLEGGVHPKHRITNYHNWFITNIKDSDTVLDIGCGIGMLAYDLAKKASWVYAIDKDEKRIHHARNRYWRKNIVYLCEDALSFTPGKTNFDVIVLSNVLEHLLNRSEFLERLSTIAPKILIRVPMIDRGWLPLYMTELRMDYRLDSDHKTEYTYCSFKEEVETAGLKIAAYKIQYGELYAVVVKC